MSKLLLSASHVSHYFAGRKILEFDRLSVYEGDKTGIVGANGAGKSTLLAILSGELVPDEGSILQEVPIQYFHQFRQPGEEAGAKDARAFGLVGKLARERLSGGEKTRLGLAAIGEGLLTFADEPTANLDAEGIRLCREKLSRCPTLLLVSHDRALLDALCTRIIEVKDGGLRFYQGNFSAYQEQRRQLMERERFEYDQYRSEKARLQAAILEKSQVTASMRKAPKRMGNSEARLHKRDATEHAEKVDGARKALISRLERLEAKEKPRETPKVFIDFP